MKQEITKRSSRHSPRARHVEDTPGPGTAGTGLSWEHELVNPGKGMPFTNLMLIPGSLFPLTMSVWSSSMQMMESGARSLTDLSLGAMRSWVGIIQSGTEMMGNLAPRLRTTG